MNKNVYKQLATMIEKETGIVYSESDFDRLVFRVEKLKELVKVSTDEELLKVFQSSPGSDLQSLLVSTSTNNETSFFRDKKPFDILVSFIIPEIMKGRPINSLKIWSAASSNGQEPYSIAMKIKESATLSHLLLDIKATDIDNEVLAKAKSGRYNQSEVQRGLPIQLLMKYFEQVEGSDWVVKREIRSLVNFSNFNLISGFYPTNEYDIVFCRNVLIYQSLENKSKVILNIFQTLKPGGFLVLGGSENLIGIKSNFKMVQVEDLMVFQKPL